MAERAAAFICQAVRQSVCTVSAARRLSVRATGQQQHDREPDRVGAGSRLGVLHHRHYLLPTAPCMVPSRRGLVSVEAAMVTAPLSPRSRTDVMAGNLFRRTTSPHSFPGREDRASLAGSELGRRWPAGGAASLGAWRGQRGCLRASKAIESLDSLAVLGPVCLVGAPCRHHIVETRAHASMHARKRGGWLATKRRAVRAAPMLPARERGQRGTCVRVQTAAALVLPPSSCTHETSGIIATAF